jgi:hypothetical protein
MKKIDAILKKKRKIDVLNYLEKRDTFDFPGFPAVFSGKREMQKSWDSLERGKSRELKPSFITLIDSLFVVSRKYFKHGCRGNFPGTGTSSDFTKDQCEFLK